MIRKIQIKILMMNISQDSLKKIISVCQKKNLKVLIADVPLYGDAMGEKGSKADTYLGMIEHNIHTLVAFLGGD